MGEVRGIFIKLNPADDAVFLHVLRNFRQIDAKMVGEFSFEVNFGVSAAAGVVGLAGSTATGQVAEADAKGLARFDVIGSNLVGIGKQKNAGTSGSFVEFVETMQATGEQAAQHGFKVGHARDKSGIAGAAVSRAFGWKLRRRMLGTSNPTRFGAFGFGLFLFAFGAALWARLFFLICGNWIRDCFVRGSSGGWRLGRSSGRRGSSGGFGESFRRQ